MGKRSGVPAAAAPCLLLLLLLLSLLPRLVFVVMVVVGASAGCVVCGGAIVAAIGGEGGEQFEVPSSYLSHSIRPSLFGFFALLSCSLLFLVLLRHNPIVVQGKSVKKFHCLTSEASTGSGGEFGFGSDRIGL